MVFTPSTGSQVEGVMVLRNSPIIVPPDQVQLVNYYNVNQLSVPNGTYFDYQTNSFDLD